MDCPHRFSRVTLGESHQSSVSVNKNGQQQLRDLPSVSVLLDHMKSEVAQWGHDAVTSAVRAHLEVLRAAIQSGESVKWDLSIVQQTIRDGLNNASQPALKSVFNLTGIAVSYTHLTLPTTPYV